MCHRIELLLSLFLTLASLASVARSVAITCSTTTSTLEDLVACFERLTIPRDYYTCTTYAIAQPQTSPVNEFTGWTDAITRLLNADGTCALPPNSPISSSYTVSRFTDAITRDPYCVLHETNAVVSPTRGTRFEKGWGVFIVPANNVPSIRPLHFSVPHPLFDTGTPAQAAITLKRTVSKSLLIEGRHRHALSSVSAGGSCFESCQGAEYDRTDGAHDNREPFHLAMVAIRAWQNTHGGCPLTRCSYIQWHGKNDATCTADHVFLSSGFDSGPPAGSSSGNCYSDPDLPVNRIKAQLNGWFPPPRYHATPSDDPSCTKLTATDNIFGRLVNGVPEADVCTTPATRCGGSDYGQFVHIEQDSVSRDEANWGRWANVILGAFP
ncbi:unnamed protein product [Cyclocybe aegerita]|uniref:Uncharacterized protein n=1 Tax=Cyclocybe aegerita TaxID=1973307 RepID=A0A8S0VTU8_CYCAE|nr:unnamed protein product [Cyclocybe aegerita]